MKRYSKIEEDLKEFIQSARKHIDDNNFDLVYTTWEGLGHQNNYLTDVLLEAGINPLPYMKTVPSLFLSQNSPIDKLIIPANINSIELSAFNESQVDEMDLSKSLLDTLPAVCFKNSSISKIILPKTLTYIGGNAFSDCLNLTKIEIPESIEEIEDYVFKNCKNLQDVVLNGYVHMDFSYAFIGCSNLKNIYFYGTPKDWDKIKLDSVEKIDRLFPNLEIHFME